MIEEDISELDIHLSRCPYNCHVTTIERLTGTRIEEFPIWVDIQDGYSGLMIQVRNVAEVSRVNGLQHTRLYSRLYLMAGWELHHYEGRLVAPGTIKLPPS